MTPPALRVYFAPGYTWQTADVDLVWEEIEVADDGDGLYPDAGLTTTRGRQSLVDRFETGELTGTLVDIGRTFDPLYASSPYVGKLEPGVPVKITAQPEGGTEVAVWRGTIPGWRREREGPWATVPLKGFGLFDKAARAKLPLSVLDWQIGQLAPVGYWKLNGPQGTTTVPDLNPTLARNDGVVVGEPDFGQESLYPYGPDTSASFDGVADRIDLSGQALIPDPYHGSVVAIFATTAVPDATSEHPIYFQLTGNYPSTYNTFFLYVHDTGELWLTYTIAAAGFTAKSGVVTDGQPHIVFAQADVGGVQYGVGVDSATLAGDLDTAAIQSGSGSAIGGPPHGTTEPGYDDNYFEGTIALVAAFDVVLTQAERQTILDAYQAPLVGQRSDERITWLADWLGLPADRLNLELGQSLLGPAVFTGIASVLDYWRLIEQSENGRLFEGPDGRIRFLDRYWDYTETVATTSQADFTDNHNGPGIFYTASDVVKDDELVINSLTISRQGGPDIPVRDDASIAQYGEADEERTGLLLTTDTEIRSLGEHLIATRSTPQPRIPSLRVPLHFLDPADQATVLGLDIGYRVTVTGNPNVGDPTVLEFLIEGVDDQINPGEWWREFYVSPAPGAVPPDTEWIWDTSVWDTDTRWAPVLSTGSESQLAVWDTSQWDTTFRWAF